MSSERVDKKWASAGLEKYSSEAILGTLRHYGAALDEAEFKRLAKEEYPTRIAMSFSESWTGTGQFKAFLPVAVQALWKRWMPDQLSPEELATALLTVLKNLSERNNAGAELAFTMADGVAGRAPGDESRAKFLEELEEYLDVVGIDLNRIVAQLAAENEVAHAQRLASIVEKISPERKDLLAASVEMAADSTEATKKLMAIAEDSARPDLVRLGAVNAMARHIQPALRAVIKAVSEVQQRAIAASNVRVLRALHDTTHLLGEIAGESVDSELVSLVSQQHEALERLVGHAH